MPARSSQPDTPVLGIGMVGYAFMGAAHSRAWATVGQAFDVPLRPRMTVLAGRDEAATQRAARRYGWRHAETDWRAVIERDDVQLVDICTPGDTHAVGVARAFGLAWICRRSAGGLQPTNRDQH